MIFYFHSSPQYMVKILQGIAQVFRHLKQRSILSINFFGASRRRHNFPFGVALLQASLSTIKWLQPRRKRQRQAVLSAVSKLRRPRQWHWLSAVAVFLLINLAQSPQISRNLVPVANAATTIQTPLSTKGSRIVDATGTPVLLRGVNWFGMETDLQVPQGLWVRDYKDMLAQIKNLGYNIIRLPYSVQALHSSNISGVDFTIGSNNDLNGKTPLQVMDLVIQEAERQGLLILLDNHRLNDQDIPELWYGEGFTEADWINTWTMLADHYKNQRNVIGADLKNEPHGQASWGTGDQATDWRLAAERAGNAIQAVNPNWLIIVEGVEKNVQGGQQLNHWWGGNLEGVKNYPVRLNVPNKLVYSPHEYGPGVYNQPWFSDPTFPNNMPKRWEIGFHYIATQGIAPILIGEFGGRQVDSSSKEGIWQQKFVDYIDQNNLSFTYWDWNPNSSDTGGILLDDWKTVDVAKQQLLSKLLSTDSILSSSTGGTTSGSTGGTTSGSTGGTTSGSTGGKTSGSTGGTTSGSSTSAGSSTNAQPHLKAEALINSDWDKGFCVNLRITNPSNASTKNWQLTFTTNQAKLNQDWTMNFLPQETKYLVKPQDWAKVIQPNTTIDAGGYCADKLGSNYKPSQVSATSF
jgi:endoglucanase